MHTDATIVNLLFLRLDKIWFDHDCMRKSSIVRCGYRLECVPHKAVSFELYSVSCPEITVILTGAV